MQNAKAFLDCWEKRLRKRVMAGQNGKRCDLETSSLALAEVFSMRARWKKTHG